MCVGSRCVVIKLFMSSGGQPSISHRYRQTVGAIPYYTYSESRRVHWKGLLHCVDSWFLAHSELVSFPLNSRKSTTCSSIIKKWKWGGMTILNFLAIHWHWGVRMQTTLHIHWPVVRVKDEPHGREALKRVPPPEALSQELLSTNNCLNPLNKQYMPGPQLQQNDEITSTIFYPVYA